MAHCMTTTMAVTIWKIGTFVLSVTPRRVFRKIISEYCVTLGKVVKGMIKEGRMELLHYHKFIYLE